MHLHLDPVAAISGGVFDRAKTTEDVLTFVLSDRREYIIMVTLDQGALKGSKIRKTSRVHCFGVPLRRHFRASRFLRRSTSPPHDNECRQPAEEQ